MESNYPSCRQCRQAGEKLFLKGSKCRTAKCPIEKRKTTPGQQGKPPAARRLSEYGRQLLEKQKVKRMYGMLEGQFHRFFKRASRQKGVRGENLLSLLERRLDNVVYRLKMALSRSQARQMITHGHVCINGKKIISPSYLVDVDDEISLSKRVQEKEGFMQSVVEKRMNISIKIPDWLELNKAEKKGKILRLPNRSDITTPIEEHHIIELYSK